MGSKTFDDLCTSVAVLGHWERNQEDEEQAVVLAAEAGVNRIDREGAWGWLKGRDSIVVEADRYEYPQPTAISHFNTRSFFLQRTGGDAIVRLKWEPELTRLDSALGGPRWRLEPLVLGTPSYVHGEGANFLLAVVPNEAFILHFEIYRQERRSVEAAKDESNPERLLLPDVYFDCAVHAALAEGLKNKDETTQSYYENLFTNADLSRMFASAYYLGENDHFEGTYMAEASRLSPLGAPASYEGDGYDIRDEY